MDSRPPLSVTAPTPRSWFQLTRRGGERGERAGGRDIQVLRLFSEKLDPEEQPLGTPELPAALPRYDPPPLLRGLCLRVGLAGSKGSRGCGSPTHPPKSGFCQEAV